MTKSKHLTFRCTEEEHKLIKKHCGKNMSKYIVSRLFRGIAEEDFKKTPIIIDPDGIIKKWLSIPENLETVLNLIFKNNA